MNENKKTSITTPYVTVCNTEASSDNQEKMKYEKPEVSVVKFMFENEITWGSFESRLEGDIETDQTKELGNNPVSAPPGWWG